MALGIPVITFTNDYMKLYDQVNWSIGEEIVLIPDLIIERGNFKKIIEEISKLIYYPQYRYEMGQKGQDLIYDHKGHPERCVKSYEDIYEKIVSDIVNQKITALDRHILSIFNRINLSIKSKAQIILAKIKRKLKNILLLFK
jgi:hypothetical protein